jgi:hypothetical protein
VLGGSLIPPLNSTAPQNLCAGFSFTGKNLSTYTSLAKPAAGQAVTDPDFGSTIRRVTNVSAQWPGSQAAVPVYPTIPAWNADESLFFLYVTGDSGAVGHALFDGKTYEFIRLLDVNPPDVEQLYWDTKNPDILYYVDNQPGTGGLIAKGTAQLIRYHVSTSAKDVLHDFAQDIVTSGALAGCSKATLISGGEDPFFMSYDNDLIGLGCQLPTNGPSGSSLFLGFTYRISTGQIGATISNEATAPQALPSGRATYFYNENASTPEVRVLNPVTNAVLRSLRYSGAEHSDMLLNKLGEDVVVGAQFDGPSGDAALMMANLTTGTIKTFLTGNTQDPISGYPPSGILVTGKAYRNPGWVAVAMIGDPKFASNTGGTDYMKTGTYLDQEIALVNIDTGATCRVGHHRSYRAASNSSQSDYWAQPNVSISPSGTRILFQSDWGGGSSIDTYVLELPGYKQ